MKIIGFLEFDNQPHKFKLSGDGNLLFLKVGKEMHVIETENMKKIDLI